MFQAKQRVGEYVLDELVGQNAYAQTWRAHHHMWADQDATVKIPTDSAYLNNLRQESIRIHRLLHPNIVRPIGFDPMANPPYLITEYVAGESLRTRITRKQLTLDQAVNVLRQVLDALQHGHERGVVHGDIKPENILLDSAGAAQNFSTTGSVKVTDFGVGLAAMATVTGDAAARAQPQSGSLAYVAPEVREGAPPDVKADIYALGVVLFEMLTAERPSGAELPSDLNQQVPPWLDDVFKKSYARRERRFDSARTFHEAVLAGSASSPAEAPKPAAAPTPEPPEENPIDILPVKDEVGGDERPQEVVEIGVAESADEVALADDSEQPDVAADAELAAGPPPENEPDEEEQESQEQDGAPQAETPAGQTSSQPLIPTIPRVPSRADRDALFDEVNTKQIRAPEDLRAALKGFVETRDLDAGEAGNIRLRLIKWANSLAGGKAELDDQIVLNSAQSRPLYAIKLIMRTTRGDEAPRSHMLEHPIAGQSASVLRSGDYRLIAHLSAAVLNEKLLEQVPNMTLRMALMNLARDARREFIGRIQREDILIFRANVITASYLFDGHKYRAFMVGNALSVVSAGEPFTKIRQEPTKRAAALLNGEQIHLGLAELRRGLEDPQWEGKSMGMLHALRAKLAAAYMVEARQQFASFGWLESLDSSGNAGQLVPGNEDALSHAALVRKRVTQLQLLPGLVVAVVFVGLALFSALGGEHGPPKEVMQQLVENSFFAAGIAALIATLCSWQALRMRMARTDLAFYQAALLPTAVAGVIAFFPDKFIGPTRDAICGGALLAVIIGDVLIFKNFRRHLLRWVDPSTLAGDGLTVLGKIETLLAEDWETLQPHYLELGPLYTFTSVQTAADMTELFQSPAEQTEPLEPAPSPEAANALAELHTGDAEIDKLAGQMRGRIAAALRALAPSARMVVTIASEYSKSVANRQLGMMQANAAKIEQRGKDLAAKLTEFERLCRSPLGIGPGADPGKVRQATQWLAACNDDPDIQLLRALAEKAKTFREDQTTAIVELDAMEAQVQQAVDRMKKG